MRRPVLMLTLLAPILLVAAFVLYFPYTLLLGQARGHLANEIGAVSLVLPPLAIIAAWLVGLMDTARRGVWKWFAIVLLVPFVGSLIYGVAGPREDTADKIRHAAPFALATFALVCLLASIAIPTTGLSADAEADRRLLDLVGLVVALGAGIVGIIQSYRVSSWWWLAVFLMLTIAGLTQFVLGTQYPVPSLQNTSLPAETLPEPGVVQSFFGAPDSPTAGYLATFAIALLLALAALVWSLPAHAPTPVKSPIPSTT